MAKNQPIRAIKVIPSNEVNIPKPGSYASGTSSTGLAGDTITDLSANFLGVSNPGNTGVSNKVNIGDVVYATDGLLGTRVAVHVSEIISNTQIKVTPGVLNGTTPYEIYRSNGTFNGAFTAQSLTGLEGYSLYVGGDAAGNELSVVPAASQDTVILKGVTAGSFIPLQVVKVNRTGTTVTDILALE